MKKLILPLIFLVATSSLVAQVYLRQSTARTIKVGPFVDITDGSTREEALTVANFDIDLYQPQDVTTVPADLITNGTFASDTGWTKNSWTIAAGVADSAGAQSTDIEQTVSITENVAYEVVFDVAAQSAGNVTVKIGGTAGTTRSTVATFTETIIAGSGSLIEFTANGFTGQIDNVTLFQVPIPITAAASGSTNDMVHEDQGVYYLELTAAQLGIVGDHEIHFEITDALAHWEKFTVLEENVYDALYASGTTTFNATGQIGPDFANISETLDAAELGVTLDDYKISGLAIMSDGTNTNMVFHWLDNGVKAALAGGATTVTVEETDGTDLIAAEVDDGEIGTTNVFHLTSANPLVAGTLYNISFTATIDGSSRQWDQGIILTAASQDVAVWQGSTFDSTTDALEDIRDNAGGGGQQSGF